MTVATLPSLIGGLLGVSGRLGAGNLAAALAAAPYRGGVTASSVTARGGVWALGAATLTRTAGFAVALHGRLDNVGPLALLLGTPPEPGEVVAAAYRRWGPPAVDRLRGDFAALVLDEQSGRLVALRDWMGTRPLFYTAHGGLVVAASEVKALLAATGLRPSPDPVAADAFRSLAGLPMDRTFYEEVRAVLPNGWASADAGIVRTGEEPVEVPRLNVGREEAIAETRRLLESAVARRLPHGAAIGACVSGGMDSTTVAATAHQILRARGSGLHAGFGLAFPDVPECDEFHYSQAVCDLLEVPLHKVVIRPAELAAEWASAIQAHDGPVFATAPFSLSIVQAAAAGGVQVLLTGHGGDHWFGPHVDYLTESLLHRDPLFAIRLLVETRRRGLSVRPYAADLRRVAVRFRSGQRLRVIPHRDQGWSRLACETEERAGARVGVLVSAPLYDRDLATFAAGLAPSRHATMKLPKLLLRQVMAGGLPDVVLCRDTKTEFSAVLRLALHEDLDGAPLRRAHEEVLDRWRRTRTQ